MRVLFNEKNLSWTDRSAAVTVTEFGVVTGTNLIWRDPACCIYRWWHTVIGLTKKSRENEQVSIDRSVPITDLNRTAAVRYAMIDLQWRRPTYHKRERSRKRFKGADRIVRIVFRKPPTTNYDGNERCDPSFCGGEVCAFECNVHAVIWCCALSKQRRES